SYEAGSKAFPLSEAGDASFFAEQYADEIRYDHQCDRWLILDDRSGIWLPDVDGNIMRLALDTMSLRQNRALNIPESEQRKRAADWAFKGESVVRLTNMLKLARNFEPIADSGQDWDKIAHLLGTENGVVDLRTGVVRRAEPKERVTMRTRVPYD